MRVSPGGVLAVVALTEFRASERLHSSDRPIPSCDPASQPSDSLAELASWLLGTSTEIRTTLVFRDSLAGRLAQLAHRAEGQERVVPPAGETPTAAKGIALARLFRSRLHEPSHYATVSLGDVIALPDGYVAVRFSDGFEAGIARDGAASS
jgi:hypothetical protein